MQKEEGWHLESARNRSVLSMGVLLGKSDNFRSQEFTPVSGLSSRGGAHRTRDPDHRCRCMRFRSSRRLGAAYSESTDEFGRENCRAVERTTAWWLCSERLISSRDRRSWDARRQALWLRRAFLVRETGIAEAQARDLIDMPGNNLNSGLFHMNQ
ncbi:hypothetical protein MPL3356_110166 [Mesorhizobium plurifarium]|uniref:Uncharacterized protein n=1 Tax=Mesorhizobium plurifarium TaxID=69974 RepID=A0A090DEH7_MESPL|nr:hypothetical protein MPL3356_110166 [Mesorhizobium plurifarium]